MVTRLNSLFKIGYILWLTLSEKHEENRLDINSYLDDLIDIIKGDI